MILHQHADVADDAAHHGFAQVIRQVVFVRLAEIGFHRVAQRVERAGDHLTEGHGQRIRRIKESEIRLRTKDAGLELLFLVRNHCARVHLGASAEHRHDRAQRNELAGEGVLDHFHVPDVLVQLRLRGDDLAAIGHRTAAHGENQIDVMLPRQLRALLHLDIGGVRHDAGELDHIFALCIQNAHHFVIHAVFLDGAAAIRQHHRWAILLQQAAQILLHAALAEIHLGFVLEDKVVHRPCFLSLFVYD